MSFMLEHEPAVLRRISDSLSKSLEFVGIYVADVSIGSENIEEHINYFIMIYNSISKEHPKIQAKLSVFVAVQL